VNGSVAIACRLGETGEWTFDGLTGDVVGELAREEGAAGGVGSLYSSKNFRRTAGLGESLVKVMLHLTTLLTLATPCPWLLFLHIQDAGGRY
jgi:hypothetical protein